MPEGFILDPSMFLHRPTLTLLRDFARPGMSRGLVLPESFLTLFEEPRDRDEIFNFFAPPSDRAAPEEVLEFVQANRDSFQPFRSQPDNSQFYRELIRAAHSERIARILFEEWGFMSTQSWLFARVRQCLDKMIEAGAAALALSRKAAEKLIRRTLKLSPRASISINETLRAAAKWVALGGPTVLQIIEPASGTLVKALTGGGAGIFLYYDP